MMSVIGHKQKKKNERKVRTRREKVSHRRHKRTRKYKASGWKLNYPEIFMEIPEYPYIVRKPNK